MMLYVVGVWFCLYCEVLFHCKNHAVCSLVLLAKRKGKKMKRKNPEGIKCFCMQNDLDRGDVFSAQEHPHGCWVELLGGIHCKDARRFDLTFRSQ